MLSGVVDKLMKASYRFVDTSSRTHHVNFTEFPLCNLEHPVKLLPVGHIRLLEDCSRGIGLARVLVDNDLRLRTETQVCNEDIATTLQQKTGKTQVDSYLD